MKKKSPASGSILIVVLVFLAILSIFALTVGHTVRQRLQVIQRLEGREKLRWIAEAGIKKAIRVLREDAAKPLKADSLSEEWAEGGAPLFKDVAVGNEGRFSVKYFLPGEPVQKSRGEKERKGFEDHFGFIDEERKIDLNKVKRPSVLIELFKQTLPITHEDADALAHSILDWRDEDDNPYESGAESGYYQKLKPPYRAKNADISTLEELLFVKGMNPLLLERVRPYVTLDGSSYVNINTAPQPVLNAIGLVPSVVEKILSFRKGRDGQPGTGDDGVFQNPSAITETLRQYIYLAPDEIQNLEAAIQSGLLRVESEHFWIQSVAQLQYGNPILTVQAVVRKSDERILRWQEEYSS